MNLSPSIVNILDFRNRVANPTLVLVGMQRYQRSDALNAQVIERAIFQAKKILMRARADDIPIAHVRNVELPSTVEGKVHYPAWILGFEPLRDDMVFDVTQPSCYSSAEFSQIMESSKGHYAIAGLFGETIGLSTAIDAARRKHRFSYIYDAVACRTSEAISATTFQDVIAHVISQYGNVMSSEQWLDNLFVRRQY